MKASTTIITILLLLCTGLQAQTKKGVEVVNVSGMKFKIDIRSQREIEFNKRNEEFKRDPEKFKKERRERAKKTKSRFVQSTKYHKNRKLKVHHIEMTFVNAETSEKLSEGIQPMQVSNDVSLQSGKENYNLFWDDRLSVNKKGKLRLTKPVNYPYMPDSIISFVIMHPDMEPCGINVDMNQFKGMSADIGTIYLKPKAKQ